MTGKFKRIAMLLTVLMAVSSFGVGCAKKVEEAPAKETAEVTEVATPEVAPTTEAAAAPTIDYPTKPIQLVIPVTPGGDSDLNGRTFAKYLEKELGQPIVVMNITGASGAIGSRQVKDSNPDGYTALFFHTELMIPYLMGISDFTFSDFQIPGIVATDDTTILAVNGKSKWKTLKEYVDDAKSNPGKVEFGVSFGGYPHLIGLALEDAAQIDLNITDVGGNAEKIVALLGQQTDAINTQYGLTQDYIKTGDFLALASLSSERNSLTPEIPTAKEQGVDMEFGKTFFFGLPKDTPKEISDKFSKAVEAVVNNPEYQKEAIEKFLTPKFVNSEDSIVRLQEIQDMYGKYAEVMKAATAK